MSLAGAKGVERPSEHRLGVLFEISIVCHVLCSWFWRGVGVSLFFGGLFWLVRRVFSGFWGFLCFSLFCSCLLGWVAGCGGFRGSGFGAPGCLASFSWGAGRWLASFLLGGGPGGASARARFLSCPVLAVVGVGWSGSGARAARFPWWGSGCARFLLLLVVVGVFGCFFRPVLLVSSGSAVLGPLLGCGFRGVGGCGGCRVGFGVVFSPASVVLARACLGLGWVLFGEFDPGSGRTLAACLTHASRTGPPLWGWVEWRTGEYHVSNLPFGPG